MLSTLSFSYALALLKEGERVSRSGWNGKGMWLILMTDWGLADVKAKDAKYITDFKRAPFIAMKTADDKLVPWLASQTDILAEDWGTVD